MKILNALSLGTLAVTAMLATACAGKHDSSSTGPDDNSDSTESSASSAQSSRLDQMVFGPVQSTDPSAAANNVANASEWWPAGCASRTKDATAGVVHIHLNDCSGPFGLAHWSGDITVTFSAGASAGTLHAQGSSSNMTVNGKPVDWSREADLTIAGGIITAVGNGSWTREDVFGETVAHTTSFTTTIDPTAKCRSSTGTAVTRVGAREVDATFTDYKVCKNGPDGSDGCPTGSVEFHHKLSGRTIDISFDGSEQAKITSGGVSIEYPLVCVAGT